MNTKRLEVCIAACFYFSGLISLMRRWKQQKGKTLVILNYHRAMGGDLRRHMLYLRRHYRILQLETALEELYAPYKSGQDGNDPRPPMVLTFDDGYYDNYSYGFALAKALQVPLTIFLIPGYMESGRRFWWYEGEHLATSTPVANAEIAGRVYHLNKAKGREALAQDIDARVRCAASVVEREQFLLTVHEALNVPAECSTEEKETISFGWKEAREMQESGWVSFGAHTMHHPILAHLTEAAEMEKEVRQCREVMEQQLGRPVRTFAYPVGQPADIGVHGKQVVQQAGYSWAVTTTQGLNTCETDPLLLRRIVVDVDQHWLVIAAKACCAWDFFSRLFWLPRTLIHHFRKQS